MRKMDYSELREDVAQVMMTYKNLFFRNYIKRQRRRRRRNLKT